MIQMIQAIQMIQVMQVIQIIQTIQMIKAQVWCLWGPMAELKEPPCVGHSSRDPLQMRDQRSCEGMLRQTGGAGNCSGFPAFPEGLAVERRCSILGNIPLTPCSQHQRPTVPSSSRALPVCLSRVISPAQPQNKAFPPERKRSRGERSKRKGRRGRGTKGKGQLCTPAPALPEPCSPRNPPFG